MITRHKIVVGDDKAEVRETIVQSIRRDRTPIVIYPEGATSNGNVGLFRYSAFVFGLDRPIFPVGLRCGSTSPGHAPCTMLCSCIPLSLSLYVYIYVCMCIHLCVCVWRPLYRALLMHPPPSLSPCAHVALVGTTRPFRSSRCIHCSATTRSTCLLWAFSPGLMWTPTCCLGYAAPLHLCVCVGQNERKP